MQNHHAACASMLSDQNNKQNYAHITDASHDVFRATVRGYAAISESKYSVLTAMDLKYATMECINQDAQKTDVEDQHYALTSVLSFDVLIATVLHFVSI